MRGTSPPASSSHPTGQPTSGKRVREEIEELLDQVSGEELDGDTDGHQLGLLSARKRAREEDMPWFNSSLNSDRRISCVETCRTLLKFSEDISEVKSLLRVANGLPEGIPSTQWDRILRGKSVDLNQILSAMHFVHLDEERKGCMGTLRSYLPWQNPSVKSKQELNGRQRLDGCQMRSSSFSLIGGKNYTSMPSILRVSSLPNTPMLTLRSSSTTNQSATRMEEARTLYSPTINASAALAKPSYMLMESNTRVEAREKAREETVQRRERVHQKRTFAGASTARADVASQMRSAITSTSAKVVEKLDMERTPAPPTNHSEL